MASMQKVTLLGNVGNDPEEKTIPGSGKSTVQFSLAANSKGNDGSKVTTWYRITCWSNVTQSEAKQLQKGSVVMVLGNLRVREYTDKTGAKRTDLGVDASDVYGYDRQAQAQEPRGKSEDGYYMPGDPF